MRSYFYLFLAITCEICATSCLPLATGFTKPLPTFAVLSGYAAAFYCMSLALVQIPMGVAYAIWSGVGTAFLAVIGWIVYRQHLNAAGIVGIILILIGCVLLNLFGNGAHGA